MLNLHPESFYDEVKAAYPDNFLAEIFKDLRIEDSREIPAFKKIIIKAGATYLTFLRAERIKRDKHGEDLKKYAKALENAKSILEEMRTDIVIELKLDNAIQKELDKKTAINAVLETFFDEGFSYELLAEFFDAMSKVAKEARTVDVSDEQIGLSPKMLWWWAATLKIHWPKSAKNKFTAGDKYVSAACGVLVKLLKRINREEPVSSTQIKSVIKRVNRNDWSNDPAKLLLEKWK